MPDYRKYCGTHVAAPDERIAPVDKNCRLAYDYALKADNHTDAKEKTGCRKITGTDRMMCPPQALTEKSLYGRRKMTCAFSAGRLIESAFYYNTPKQHDIITLI